MDEYQVKKLLCIVLLTATTAQAEFLDGNKLLSRIKGDTYDYVNAVGYITGVSDTIRGAASCPPDNITAGQITEIGRAHV